MAYKAELLDYIIVSGHAEYTVKVSSESEGSWTFRRRYRDFRLFSQQIADNVPVAIPDFPPKKWFGNLKPEFIEKRRADLDAYMTIISNMQRVTHSKYFLSFVKPGDREMVRE